MHGSALKRAFGTRLAGPGSTLPTNPVLAIMHELTPSQLALLRRASVDVVDAPSAPEEVDALSDAGLLGREACNTYRITTTGLLLLEQLDSAQEP